MGWPRLIVASVGVALVAAGCATILGMEEGDPTLPTGAGGAGGVGGTASSSGTGGTSSGTGGSSVCEPGECPGSDGDCARPACVNGLCDMVIEATGTPCAEDGGSYCDGKSNCVQCISPDHCGGDPCQDYQCVGANCDDQMLDGDETDIDCGGSCGGCPNGKMCATYADCQSQSCVAGYCVPCVAHLQCPTGDWYCDGGYCLPKKEFGDKCVEDYECKTGYCTTFPITGSICSWTDG
ncbi:MAG: hypothetical protein JRI68_15645 [Deltaproteobacteria bacterium]|nr:hypothetical protein [Deltaproteobacteria bacterium]